LLPKWEHIIQDLQLHAKKIYDNQVLISTKKPEKIS